MNYVKSVLRYSGGCLVDVIIESEILLFENSMKDGYRDKSLGRLSLARPLVEFFQMALERAKRWSPHVHFTTLKVAQLSFLQGVILFRLPAICIKNISKTRKEKLFIF